MSATNDFLPFAIGGGANVEDQADYSVDTLRTNGNQPGVAVSALNNKALRQGTFVASQVAQFLANVNNMDVQDNTTSTQLLAQLVGALQFLPPVINTFTSSTGTWNTTFVFMVSTPSVSPTVGATYTDSGSTTFTVVKTVTLSGGVVAVYATGGTAPVVGAAPGTLTKTAGTGDATVTYYAVRAPLSLEVLMVGGGGGGGSTGSGASNGTAGGNSTFGTSLLVANGGSFGAGGTATNGGVGGTTSLGSGPQGIALSGGQGGSSQSGASIGGFGGANSLSSAGSGGTEAGPGNNAAANSGGGGGGAGASSGVNGAGGGAGGYIKAIINNPLIFYPYAVGSGGTGGTVTGGTAIGGNGAAGFIQATANYQ
jgi:hypothetical protein